MTILYVREQGAMVRRSAEQIKVTRKDDVLSTLPVREVEQVVLYGNVQVTTQAVALLLRHEIDVVFLTYHGTFLGRLAGAGSKDAQLRHAQLRLSGDDQRSLTVAKSIVRAKLTNQRNLLRMLSERAPAEMGPQMVQATRGVDLMRLECGRANSSDSLRGFEGKAGMFYFGAIKTLLDPSWGFQGRAYNPAPDPFNAQLSFGYSLLLKDVSAAIQVAGLDPYLGCLHALEYNRPALAFDLMEEFRPLVVDWAMLDLVMAGKIRPGDFTATSRSDRPVELGAQLVPMVIAAYEDRLTETVVHTASGMRNALRRCIELQVRLFAGVAAGNRQEYTGLVV